MKSIRMMILGAAAVAVLGVSAASMPAFADDFKFSFDTGNVRLGYSDGYWDHSHKWHNWKNAAEAHAYQERYHDRYVEEKHTMYKNSGWRDKDGDGIPDRLDNHPNNPHKN